jgi:hypothetical protein
MISKRRHDIQHNDTQHMGLFPKLNINDTLHNGTTYIAVLLSVAII